MPPPSCPLRSATLLLLAALLTSCASREEGAVQFTVVLDPALRADCVSFVGSEGGARRVGDVFARVAGRNRYVVGVPRASYPVTLTWQATAVVGACANEATWKVTSASAATTVSFPETGVLQRQLSVGLPPVELDGDRDGFVDVTKQGDDCNDGDATVYPMAPQACASPVDSNCDGKLFCDDAACASESACQRPAVRLTFEGAPATLAAFDCSGEVRLVAVDAQGQQAPAPRRVTVALTASEAAATGLELFSDGTCATPASNATLTLGYGQASVPFSFRPGTAGALAVQAKTATLGEASFTSTVVDQPVAELRASPPALAVAAGACSQAMTLEALDAQQRPTKATASIPVTPTVESPPTADVRFYTNASCTTEGGPVIAAGQASASAWVIAQRAVLTRLRFSGVGVATAAVVNLTVTAGAPARVAFQDPTASVVRSLCGTQAVELRVFDAVGNPTVAGSGGLSAALSVTPAGGGTGTLELFDAPGCGGAPLGGSVTVAEGQGSTLLYLRSSTPGRYGVTATYNGASTPLEVSVSSMAPTALAFPAPATEVVSLAGSCSPPVRVQARESAAPGSLLSPVLAATVVALDATPAGRLSFFSDATCTAALPPANTLTIPPGGSDAVFYFRGRVTGPGTIDATRVSGDPLAATNPDQQVRVAPGPTRRFAFTPPLAVAVTANDCTPAFGLRALDAFDNPTFAALPAVTLTATPQGVDGGVGFFTGPGCSGPTTTVPLVDGGATFWARAQAARTYALDAITSSPDASTRLLDGGSGAAVLTVSPGTAVALTVTKQPASPLQAGTCTDITVERRDTFGNPAPGGALTLSVSAANGAVLTIHNDLAGCTNRTPASGLQFAGGATSTTFFVRGVQANPTTVTVSATGLGTVTTNPVTVTPGVATQLQFTTAPPMRVTAGSCTLVTVRRFDADGNLTPLPGSFAGSLTTSGPGATNLSLGSTCTPPPSAMSSTAQLTFDTSDTVVFSFVPRAADSLTFTANGPGLTTAVTASTTVDPAALASLRFVGPPTSAQVAGACVPLSLEAVDAFANRVSTVVAGVTLSSTAAGTFFTSNACTGSSTTSVTVPANAPVTFFFRPAAAILHSVTAALTSPALATSTSFTVTPGPAGALAVTKQPASPLPAGTCTDITVERRDTFGNPAPGGVLALSASAANGAVLTIHNDATGCANRTPASVLQFAANSATATFFVRGLQANPTTVSVSATGLGTVTTNPVTVTPGVARRFEFSPAIPMTSMVDSCTVITVRRRDDENNLTTLPANLTGTVTAADSIANLRLGATCTPTAPATVATTTALTFGTTDSATFAFVPRTVGTLSFTASGMGITTNATGSTTVGAGALASVRFVTPPTGLQVAGACIALTLEALDVGDNRISTALTGVTLSSTAAGTFFTSNACTGSPTPSVTVPANAPVSFGFRPTAAATHIVSADPPGAVPAGTAMFTVTPGTATALTRSPAFTANTAADTCVTFTLTRTDASSNPTTVGGALPVTVTLSGAASLGPQGAQVFASAGSCMGPDSPSPATVTIPDLAQTAVFSVKGRVTGALTMNLGSALASNPPATSTTVVAGPLSALAFTTTPPSTASVVSCNAVTLEGRDVYGNPTSLTSSITLSTTPAMRAAFHLTPDCSGVSNDFIAAPNTPTVVFRLKPIQTGTGVQLQATSGGATTSQLWNFTPAPTGVRFKSPTPPVTRLACSGPFIVEPVQSGTTVPSGEVRTVSLSTTMGAAVQWFSDSLCTTPSATASMAATDTETPPRYLVATDTMAVTVKAEAPGLAPDFVSFTPSGNLGTLGLTVTTTSPELEFRSCLPLTVTRTLAGAPFAGTFTTTATLSKAGIGQTGVTLHSTSACTGAEVTNVQIPSGQSSVTVYAAGRSAERQGPGPFTVATASVTATDQASTGFGSGSVNVNVHPAVRRGNCTIANGQTVSTAGSSQRCTIQPALPTGALGRSFFTFQAVVDNAPNTPGSAGVTCALNGAATELICSRGGNNEVARIEWQLVSMAVGLQVAHFEASVSTPSQAIYTVDISSAGLSTLDGAFLLFGVQTEGSNFNSNDTISAEFTSPTTVTLRQPVDPQPVDLSYSLQVVRLTGTTVTRGSSAGVGLSFSVTPTSAAPGGTTSALLYSQRLTSASPPNSDAICKYRLRGVLSGGPTLTFSRGAGNTAAPCSNADFAAVTWERLSFPSSVATVQEFPTVTINGITTTSATQSITGPLDRTWSFLGGQGTGGQSGGETNRTIDDRVGYSQARITITASDTLTLVRGGNNSTNSTFGLFVVTFPQ
ncbi:MAG: putative metal-binding motif-containing protein [Myxococcaceae bacterium]|jgi:hypothetical protein|nr:putative metal-binding motif-containing protein [Myxococcaceae bacterium]